jgi:hypothetical protein
MLRLTPSFGNKYRHKKHAEVAGFVSELQPHPREAFRLVLHPDWEALIREKLQQDPSFDVRFTASNEISPTGDAAFPASDAASPTSDAATSVSDAALSVSDAASLVNDAASLLEDEA